MSAIYPQNWQFSEKSVKLTSPRRKLVFFSALRFLRFFAKLATFGESAKIALVKICLLIFSVYDVCDLSAKLAIFGKNRESEMGTCLLLFSVYDCCDFSQNWQFSEKARKSRVLVRLVLLSVLTMFAIFRKTGKFRKNCKNSESQIGTCLLLLSFYEFCHFWQNWQFSEKLQKSGVIVMTCLLIFSVYDFCEKLQFFASACKLDIIVIASSMFIETIFGFTIYGSLFHLLQKFSKISLTKIFEMKSRNKFGLWINLKTQIGMV